MNSIIRKGYMIVMFFLLIVLTFDGTAGAQDTRTSQQTVEAKAGVAVLEITDAKTDLGNIEKGTNKDFTITIKNAGKGDLLWDTSSDQPWLVPGAPESFRNHAKRFKIDAPSIMTEGPDYFKTGELHEEGAAESLSALRTKKLDFTVFTQYLPEGEYTGSILIKSNGGDKIINVSMKIVTLSSIVINPISIKIRVGQRRSFRAIGIWSDGSRTDLSSNSEGSWFVSDNSVGSFLTRKPIFIAKTIGRVSIKKVRGDIISNTADVDVGEFISEPVMYVTPREVDLGAIGPGESSRGAFSLKNVGSKTLLWSTKGPSGWTVSDSEDLKGTVKKSPLLLRITIKQVDQHEEAVTSPEVTPLEEMSSVFEKYPFLLRIETMQSAILLSKELLPGSYREMIPIQSNGGERHVFITFTVAEEASRPHLAVEPQGIDLGIVEAGKRLTKKIKVVNAGKDVLKWNAALQGKRKRFAGIPLKKGKYISLLDSAAGNVEEYSIPERLKDTVFLSGKWLQDNGYPSSNGDSNSLKVAFFGTGVVIFAWKDIEGGMLDAFVDDEFIGTIQCRSDKRERLEIPIVEDIGEGPHLLNLLCRGGNIVIEGIRVYSENFQKNEKGWIRIYPVLGTTTTETDYVNVMINSGNLSQGQHNENILFYSNGGYEVVEVSLDLIDRTLSNVMNIYRYTKGPDCLFTTEPSYEDPALIAVYESGGIAFRLFRKGTFGTTEFYRWYNPLKGNHFYSYDRNGGGKSLTGYNFEGSIGNIATSRLSRTKELYRWYNPTEGTYFYSTDLKGEGVINKGYNYDGIAGYVR